MLNRARPPATVDVWLAEPADLTSSWLAHLDAVERSRAADLPGPQASRFIQGRALLRAVLGEHLGCAPREVPLHVRCPTCAGPHGPVSLATGTGTGPHLSLTRAGALVAVAVSEAGPVGVDVESHAAISAAPLGALPPSRRGVTARTRQRRAALTSAVARSWVSAEAVLKATGAGLRTDPADLVISSRRGRRTALTPDGTRAVLADLDLGPGVAGAVAVVPHAPGPTEPGGPSRLPRLSVHQHDGDAVLAALGTR
ncbi:hypothetical protein J4G33_09775 [Actinotalea sp. BY-33]|uniref:4'-phosphopantetheinyl transferase superfamily protein n=1 Tax=Actinotalea soli TaxID=2819234 RepID=A0A939LPM6_9CELL|nr:4'-phosphopantetheinyl transferase superfamily protein [Actinotalea soli]MBO1752091.1 hypothetical protein [Actinotalea soli]